MSFREASNQSGLSRGRGLILQESPPASAGGSRTAEEVFDTLAQAVHDCAHVYATTVRKRGRRVSLIDVELTQGDRTAVRAAWNTPNGDITCPRVRTPQTRAGWCLRSICACNISHPLCDPFCFENRGWWVVCLRASRHLVFRPVGVVRYRLAGSLSAARPHPVR